MKPGSTFAKALVLAGTALLVLQPGAALAKDKKDAAAAAGPKYDLSPDVRKAVVAAQTAFDAKDYAGEDAQLTAAEAASKTEDDRFVVANLRLQLGSTTQNNPMLAKALDYLLTSPRLTQEQQIKFYTVRGQIAQTDKDYAKAQASYEKLAALTPNDPAPYTALTDLANDQKNYAQALTYLDKAIALQQAANQPIDPTWVRNAFVYAYQSKNPAAIQKYSLLRIKATPTADTWRDVLYVYRDAANLDEAATLDLFRLMRATNALKGEGDFVQYADIADRRGLPGEAVAALDAGGAQVGNSRQAKEIRASAAPKVNADKASLGNGEAGARNGANGRAALGVADGYLSYGQYDKAAEFYRLAVQKGGVDADTANTRLGIALAQAGQKDAARQAFALVKGPRAGLAQYWTAWIDRTA